jgi:hypothetical protein
MTINYSDLPNGLYRVIKDAVEKTNGKAEIHKDEYGDEFIVIITPNNLRYEFRLEEPDWEN